MKGEETQNKISKQKLMAPIRSQIRERTISLRFLGIILRVIRLEVSVYHVNITNQFQVAFAQGGRGE
jgi:hypothetical protein